MTQQPKQDDLRMVDPYAPKTNKPSGDGLGMVDPFQKDELGMVDPYVEKDLTDIPGMLLSEVGKIPGVQRTISKLSPVIDVLARGQYASARFADALADQSKTVFDAISEGFNEFLPEKWAYTKQQKLSYSDFIRRRFPDFAQQNPTATTLLGFVGDTAGDPTSYFGSGILKEGLLVGGKVITKSLGKKLVEGLAEASTKAFVGKDGTLELIKLYPKAVSKAEKTMGVLDKKLAKAEEAGIDTILASQGQADRIIARLNIEKDLKDVGYFDAVRNKQDEIEKFLNNLSGDPNVKLAETIAKDETVQDLMRFGKERVPEELFQNEVRQRIDQRILSLAEASPELQKQFFEGRGLFLKFGLPFGKQTDVLKVMGLEGIVNRFNALTAYMESASDTTKALVNAGRKVGEFVSRDFGLPEEYIKRRNDLQDYMQYAVGQTERDTLKLFTLDKDSREKIGTAMAWIDDQSRLIEKNLLGRDITDDEGAKLFNIGMKKHKLNEKERAVAVKLKQDYAEMSRIEKEVGLLKNNLINYSPRGYELIKDADEFSLITRGKLNKDAVPQPFLASSYVRKFMTNAEAELAGLHPELDAAILYAHRLLASRRAVAVQQFRDSIEEMFGTVSTKGSTEHTGILPTRWTPGAIPQRIIDDMKMMGEAIYPSGMNETAKYWLQFYDRLQRWFKIGATTAKPLSFATKQVFSNTFQAALVSGAKAFKGLDPRVALDAALLLAHRGKDVSEIPWYLNNFISRHFTGNNGLDGVLASRVVLSKITGDEQLMNFAKQYKLRSALGQQFTGEELVQLARENGIIRELDATGERFSNKVLEGLTQDKQTYKNVVGELAKWWKHAALVEDYGRMMLFVNGIRMGYTAEDATKLVNKALFDYQRGLSKVENSIVKRAVPFYSFQRFALPFIFKQTLKQPGNPATMEKVLRTMEKLLVTGETLNPSEENIFNEAGNNFVLEQGRLFSGFDKSGKGTLNILNNLTPFDVLNFFVLDQEGKPDIERTIKKSVFGALTPFIKMPIAALADKDFFTDKTIAQASKLGNVEGSLGKIIPQWAKDLMGWENRYNAATGKTAVYANPFLAYYGMQVIPALRDIVKGNEDVNFENGNLLSNALFAAMNAIAEASTPVKRQQFDLKEMQEFSTLKTYKEYKDLKGQIFGAYVRGSKNDVDKNQTDLINLMKVLGENQKIRMQNQVRGQGLGHVAPVGSEPIAEPTGISAPPPTKEYK